MGQIPRDFGRSGIGKPTVGSAEEDHTRRLLAVTLWPLMQRLLEISTKKKVDCIPEKDDPR